MKQLIEQTVMAVRLARKNLHPCTVSLGRSDIGALVHNRRPRPAHSGILHSDLPQQFNYQHESWDPKVLGDGMDFGPVDRAMTIISFRDSTGHNLASIIHLAAHAVAIYPFLNGISADWPGKALNKLDEKLGGHSIFLQGTAGDINPAFRGELAVEDMASSLCDQGMLAYKYSARLQIDSLSVNQSVVGLPLTSYGQESTGLKSISAEIQLITLGPLAIVALPGEPMTAIGQEIKRRSPFSQTIVLGYSNGKGCFYIGMPGEKSLGGYESGEKTSLGTDNAGLILAEAAIQLLLDSHHKMD
jgi:hypothetical protein